MKKFILDFLLRGLIVCGLGPIVLAILYLILRNRGVIDVLTVNQVCIGIFSITVLAFIAGGLNAVYKIERLPLMVAILIHGGVLYISYLCTYLINDWLALSATPILVFTLIFALGYLSIWIIIYCVTNKNTKTLNERLKKKQLSSTNVKKQ